MTIEQKNGTGFFKNLILKGSFQRFLVLAGLTLVLFLAREMITLFLLTFILTYLMYSIQQFLAKRLNRFVRVQQKLLVLVLYVFLAAGIVFGLFKLIPLTIDESIALANQVIGFIKHPPPGIVGEYIHSLFKGVNIVDYAAGYAGKNAGAILKSLTSVSRGGLNILLAFVLSLFLMLERNRVMRFTARLEHSKLSVVYRELAYFGSKFTHSFGKVIETQILIAFINGVLSTIALAIMGFHNVFGLGIMIFLLGLIPVAGVIISLIPLSMIAFNSGGFANVLYVWAMIAVLHAIESYVLNPKLMSQKTKLPVFYTFVVLLVAEHFMGIWGLIIGIPIFIFLLDILDVKSPEEKAAEALQKQTQNEPGNGLQNSVISGTQDESESKFRNGL